jgi:hypothetical protein
MKRTLLAALVFVAACGGSGGGIDRGEAAERASLLSDEVAPLVFAYDEDFDCSLDASAPEWQEFDKLSPFLVHVAHCPDVSVDEYDAFLAPQIEHITDAERLDFIKRAVEAADG